MKKIAERLILVLIVVFVIVKIGIPIAKHIHDNSHVKFSDENMAKVLYDAVYGRPNITPENITYKELKQIKKLHIGFSGDYTTLKDLKYCTGLEELNIDGGVGSLMDNKDSYFSKDGKNGHEVTDEELNRIQKELGEILPELPNLKELWVCGGIEWNSVEFLKDCKQIEEIHLYNNQTTDYSALKGCSSLKHLEIQFSNLSEAKSLIGIEKLEYLAVINTPLAKNMEEIEKLQKAYPNGTIAYKTAKEAEEDSVQQ